MALNMNLMVNGRLIGYLNARRRQHRQPPQVDDVCLYDWQCNLNGTTTSNAEESPLAHRFGDGAWALVARVIAAAGYEPTKIVEGER